MTLVIMIYLAVGVIGGILAGLLGIGGGLVIVPMMVFCLSFQNVSEAHVMHLALGTSMASIIFTSISSFRAHHKRGAVRWDVVARITPGILAGSFFGTWIAAMLPTRTLKITFGVFLLYVGIQMILNKKPKPSRTLPGAAGMIGVGGGIGAVSSLVGIGGGTLSVPFLTWCNVVIHHAIGTASAIGLPIALAGSAGYVVNGLGSENLPPWCLGYVYLPALAAIVSMSVLFAPLGVRMAHALPVEKLKKVFAILILIVGVKMLTGALL